MRLASYNLLHGMDLSHGGDVDLDRAAAAIAGLDADVTAVQEADRDLPRTGGLDQVAAIGSLLGLHVAFAPALLGNPDTRWRRVPAADPGGPAYGVGMLSRKPLLEVVRHALPGGGDGERSRNASLRNPGWDYEPRVALSVRVQVADATLRVTTAHLSYLPWRALAQVRALGRAAAGSPGEAAAIIGDLNLPAWPVRLALARDWRHAGGVPTYPAWSPRMQVDQLLVRGPVRVTSIDVAPTATSDHLPLVAALEFGGPP